MVQSSSSIDDSAASRKQDRSHLTLASSVLVKLQPPLMLDSNPLLSKTTSLENLAGERKETAV